jgi:hypothetical protein
VYIPLIIIKKVIVNPTLCTLKVVTLDERILEVGFDASAAWCNDVASHISSLVSGMKKDVQKVRLLVYFCVKYDFFKNAH